MTIDKHKDIELAYGQFFIELIHPDGSRDTMECSRARKKENSAKRNYK